AWKRRAFARLAASRRLESPRAAYAGVVRTRAERTGTPVELIIRHACLLVIVVTCANGAVWWVRGKKEIASHPQLERGYRYLVRRWLVYGNVPWVVMGGGILFGGVPSVSHYLNRRNGACVIAWCVTVAALSFGAVYWVFFRQGGEALVRHPGHL